MMVKAVGCLIIKQIDLLINKSIFFDQITRFFIKQIKKK